MKEGGRERDGKGGGREVFWGRGGKEERVRLVLN